MNRVECMKTKLCVVIYRILRTFIVSITIIASITVIVLCHVSDMWHDDDDEFVLNRRVFSKTMKIYIGW